MPGKQIIHLTADGSHTIVIPDLNISYHSRFGALQESKHVFIKEGLDFLLRQNIFQHRIINILEVGFGTGLNALLSLHKAISIQQKISYVAIEPFPISVEQAEKLNYAQLVNSTLQSQFLELHTCNWQTENQIDDFFSFMKLKIKLQNFLFNKQFHLIYFDAFDPTAQPELWTESIFKKLHALLFENAILVTYCSKGIVRRAMQSTGFTIKKFRDLQAKEKL